MVNPLPEILFNELWQIRLMTEQAKAYKRQTSNPNSSTNNNAVAAAALQRNSSELMAPPALSTTVAGDTSSQNPNNLPLQATPPIAIETS